MVSFLLSLLAAVIVSVVLGPPLLKALIRRRLGGYRRLANVVDTSKPARLEQPRRVAVIGSGVAGLTAATTLARKGFSVTVLEANAYLGGKMGSWQVTLGGEPVWVSHGFHAFFPHYHNLNTFMDSLALRRDFRSIGDYVIVGRGGDSVRFGKLETTPVFNLLSLAKAGVFGVGDALQAPGRDLYGLFLEYEHDQTFEKFDHLSFDDFVRRAKVPPRLKLAFDTFARAFFADEDKLSLAELLKSFHFYYLSHDGGLVYDYPVRDYEPAFLSPIREELLKHGATIRLSTPVKALEKTASGFLVDGEAFDQVVCAPDVVGANAIITRAKGLPESLTTQLSKLQPGQRYAVWRLWVDKDARQDIPVFVITDRVQALDAFTVYHRFEQESADWVKRHGGAVLELHCYAVPEAFSEAQVKAALMEELVLFFPELEGLTVKHEVFQMNRNFTAFHVGRYQDRPTVETQVPGLVFAGDWVKLPFPAMLLEAACASGLWAANELCRQAGVREEQVVSVPLRGLMAGMPQPPARAKLLESK
jgi:isorenieratene synthase